MTDPPSITWDNVVAMYEKLGARWNEPRATQLRMNTEYAEDFVKAFASPDVSMSSASFFGGIPIVPDDSMLYGEWRIIDQFGNTMKEGMICG